MNTIKEILKFITSIDMLRIIIAMIGINIFILNRDIRRSEFMINKIIEETNYNVEIQNDNVKKFEIIFKAISKRIKEIENE